MDRQVEKEKAKISRERIQNADSSITITIKEIKNDKVLNSETYKGNEPMGVWIYGYGKNIAEKDYNFKLIYSESNCEIAPVLKSVVNYFEDNPSLVYQAPKITTGEDGLSQFLVRNMRYPAKARDNNITGKVHIAFNLTTAGLIENLVVTKGKFVELDKEAIRVIRKLKFSTPAMLNGKPIDLCLAMPINFALM
jgi:TonB family protein